MKPIFFSLMMVLAFCGPLDAKEMRALQVEADRAKQVLMQKAAAELQAAEQEAAQSRQRILQDQSALQTAVDQLKVQNSTLHHEIDTLATQSQALTAQEKALSEKLAETDSMIGELIGVLQANAKDIAQLVRDNLQTALAPVDLALLEAIGAQSKFPGMADIHTMVDTLFTLVTLSGQVSLSQGPIIDRAGRPQQAQILAIGPFTAAYRLDDEVGFLNHISADQQLYALSRLPSARMQKQIRGYIQGRQEAVPLDISRGGALRQLVQHVSFWQQVPLGGPIGWIIVALFGLGVLIVIERIVFFHRRRIDGDGLIGRIDAQAATSNWAACKQLCVGHIGKPLARVMLAGLDSCHLKRQELENVLQEAILKEIPRLEQFLSTLGMLATIAPLLGLLGTVTGMINTFHVITQHGSADPRLMSSGISEALVTTMLGLIAAIPFLFVHTLLSRKADTTITQMEEKAVALVNIVDKSHTRHD